MERKIIYIADDGVEFEYEENCRAYERSLLVDNLGNHLRLWDEKMNPIDPKKEDALEDAYFIYADTPEAREFVNAECDIYTELGWDTTYAGYIHDDWLDLSAEHSRIGKILKAMTM